MGFHLWRPEAVTEIVKELQAAVPLSATLSRWQSGIEMDDEYYDWSSLEALAADQDFMHHVQESIDTGKKLAMCLWYAPRDE
jgi:hypothetical protein